jgi:phosphoribosylaminoimidazolecarboxamide formyltransferase/IMP cyclohydrolase
MKKIRRAIISVTDKTGVLEFSKALTEMGVEIISTGGTAELLEEGGVHVIPISSYTGFPEMLDGRVKTLHPKIHGGILGIRKSETHRKEMENHDILPIDMVVVNLYRFEETIKAGSTLKEAIENIDIGGPTMIRAAAKNFNDVSCVTDPADYGGIIGEMRKNDGCVSEKTRFTLAKKVFELVTRYDGAISTYLGSIAEGEQAKRFPETFTVQLKKIQDLRYGENPHQAAAFYGGPEGPSPLSGTLSGARKHQGKELSNILDLDSAVVLSREFHEPAAIIIKHNNPCGAAMSKEGLLSAYNKALACDSKSSFGGIVGFNGTVTGELASRLTEIFLEAVIAPAFENEALDIFKKKKNLRVIETGEEAGGLFILPGLPPLSPLPPLELKRVSGGFLVQTPDM